MEFKPNYRIVTTFEDMQKAFFVRGVVFVHEQECPYEEEFDEHDLRATHFIATAGGEPVATARIRFVKGSVKFERLAVLQRYRGTGVGRDFFRFVLEYAEGLGYPRIIMHAQAYITGLYEKFGFTKKGEMFTEANIDHYFMEKVL